MAASDELHKLTDKAKQAEQKAANARQQAKADLEKTVNSSRASMRADAAKLGKTAHASQEQVSTWWDEQRQAWNAHIDKMHQGMSEQNAKRKAEGKEFAAEQAEADAYFAIDFALSAIDTAEYSVLDAILARENADEATAKVGAGHTR